jgi:hypothetical protein
LTDYILIKIYDDLYKIGSGHGENMLEPLRPLSGTNGLIYCRIDCLHAELR